MKKALFILDHFPPSFAPRMGYLVKYLKPLGWEAKVFSSPHPSKINKFDGLVGYAYSEEVTMPEYCKVHSLNRLLVEALGFFSGGFCWSMQDEKMYKYVTENLGDEHFDIVVCSTASFFPINCALKMAKRMDIPLLLDFRDIYEQDPYMYSTKGVAAILRRFQIMKRNSIICKATAVTTISEWHREYLSKFNKNIFLIYNGFDSDLFYPRSLEKTDKFTITYTGSVAPTNCEGSRNIDFLFKALALLAKEKAMTPETFSLNFYTDDSSIKYLIRVAEKYDIKEYISVNEWLPFEKIPKILLESNILLVLLAEKNTNGIMTTKLYEYLAMNREILCIPNIESPVCEFIRKANSGNCFDNVDDIVEYLKQKYEEWKKTGIVRCEANFEYVQQFSRKRQAEQFVGVFNNSIK